MLGLLRAAKVAIFVSCLLFVGQGCRPGAAMASDARITTKNPGRAEIAFGARKAELPPEDLGPEAPTVTQDERGQRLAYRTSGGMARIVYVVGDGLFVGPLFPYPPDFRAVPALDHVLGPLFETAGTRRADLVREIRRERGEAGVVRLLIDAVYVDDPAWEQTKQELSADSEGALADALVSALAPGSPPIMLRRAVTVVDLKAPARAKAALARARELATGSREPRAAAVLLRAVMANDKREAASIGCEVLAKKPASPPRDYDKLVEAATLAIAAAGTDCPDPKLVEGALAEPCLPYYRCSDAGPVSWSDRSKQDEPLCTKEQLANVITSELDRTTSDVLESGGARPWLFAYAALLAKDRVPAAFLAAHARRRYAITQAAEPPCDGGLTEGAACHCDEPALRLAACQKPQSERVTNGMCRFDVDDKQRKILNVVAAPGGT